MGFWDFVFGATLLSTTSYVITTWIKARHGYPLTDESDESRTKNGSGKSKRQIQLLSAENAGLKSQVSRLEERIAVLERIATDPAERMAREIESLR